MVQSTNIEQNYNNYQHDSETLLKKYDIPISHLDFPYVQQCKDWNELEKILHVLQSGQEGYYPDLMKAVEERLTAVNPKSKFLRNVSKVIGKEDVDDEEWSRITGDINKWIKEISSGNEELENRKGGFKKDNQNQPKVRHTITAALQPEDEPKTEKNKPIKSTDYASWDKYDPDTEILKMDLEEEKLKGKKKKKSPIVKKVVFNEFTTTVEAKYAAEREREKGNELYKIGEYKAALDHYTTSLQYQKTVHSFNNRAMTYLKIGDNKKAIADCDSVLRLEPNNFKANFRKARAQERLKLYNEAFTTVRKCLMSEPNDIDVQCLASRIEKNLNTDFSQKRRMVIEEVIETDEEQDEEGEVIVPIAGTSSMPEPYYVVCKKDEIATKIQEIQKTKRPDWLMKRFTVSEEEDECTVDHFMNAKSVKTKEMGGSWGDSGDVAITL